MELLKNTEIRLRAPEPEDLDVFYRWENDTELWKYGATLTPYSRYDLKNYLASSSHNIYRDNQLRLMIEQLSSGCTIGIIDLYDFEPHPGRAAVGILVDRDFRNKKVASQAIELLSTYAFSFLHIHQLYAHIPLSNAPSLSLFEKNGFVRSGVLKDWISAPEGYEDVVIMQKVN
ncbi:GNAT family N-acetyltransferase [Parabacteroides pacaensis]|uniref:GNAT family N-acetyltransferase n=1 Tax=Parabacteroides pacaensis TaxID=2086575 RepID=UPI000D0EF2D8|nr:GNAT family N-acetyltransferase [Parabacteroides pacaensis]